MEDDQDLIATYKEILELNGFKISGMCHNGQEGVDLYNKLSKKPRVILMDYRMPVKNGLEASREILESDPNANIIFLTADSQITSKLNELGIKHVLIKPFSFHILIEKLKKFLPR
ncbi:MAG: response regulator [Promethearchaeota archaeon]